MPSSQFALPSSDNFTLQYVFSLCIHCCRISIKPFLKKSETIIFPFQCQENNQPPALHPLISPSIGLDDQQDLNLLPPSILKGAFQVKQLIKQVSTLFPRSEIFGLPKNSVVSWRWLHQSPFLLSYFLYHFPLPPSNPWLNTKQDLSPVK